MKIGYMTDTHGGPYNQGIPKPTESSTFGRNLISEAELVEQLGFDGVFVPERHARSETMWPSPLMALMAMAARTSQIKLGTCILQPALYNPTQIAEDAALIDSLSDGRLILGVGAGYNEGYFRHFGVPFDQRYGRFNEAVSFLREAWRGERFDWTGKYWQMSDVLINPRGVQEGGPPLWFAATTNPAIARAAKIGDGAVLLGLPQPMSERRRLADSYRRQSLEHGRPPVIAQIVEGFVAGTHHEARTIFGESLIEEIRYYAAHGMIRFNPAIPSTADIDYDHIEPHMAIGTPEQVIDRLEEFRTGLSLGSDDWLIIRSRLPEGPGFEHAADSLRLFGSSVLPILHR